MASRPFVLLHGAWHGGWCWARVADILRGRGHRVTTPTLTGLGERAHLLSAQTDLSTFIADVLGHLAAEELTDVVLVGHSFGGCVITGVADRLRAMEGGETERILARLIHLDSHLLLDGESTFDRMDPAVIANRLKAAEKATGGLAFPVPPAAALGVTDPQDVAWLDRRLTPHPVASYREALHLSAPIGAGLPNAYVLCTDPVYAPLEASRQRVADLGWPVHPLASGHDPMITAPLALADLLESLAEG